MIANTQTKRIVLRRARLIQALQLLLGNVGLSFLLLIASLYLMGREVWVARVWQNMPHLTHIFAVGHFFVQAFISTNVAVQVLTLLTALALVWVVREARKFFITTSLRFA